MLRRADEAENELVSEARARVRTPLEEHRLPPEWLADTLGYAPLEESWIEAAAQALAYRLAYRITTTDSILGPEPEHPHQRQAYDRTEAAIRPQRHR